MNTARYLERVREFYRIHIRRFPELLEPLAREYCASYGSAAMAYTRLVSEQNFRGAFAYILRQPRFKQLRLDECELVQRLFQAGATPSELVDALDAFRAGRARKGPGACSGSIR